MGVMTVKTWNGTSWNQILQNNRAVLHRINMYFFMTPLPFPSKLSQKCTEKEDKENVISLSFAALTSNLGPFI